MELILFYSQYMQNNYICLCSLTNRNIWHSFKNNFFNFFYSIIFCTMVWLLVRLIVLIKNLPTVHSLSNPFLPQGNVEMLLNEKSFMYQVVEFWCWPLGLKLVHSQSSKLRVKELEKERSYPRLANILKRKLTMPKKLIQIPMQIASARKRIRG